ncbi:ribonuclease [Streptomyces sp. WZ.A104]|uniref:ribonuclease domain-containing protein n=1 Tax=unclassified Streptomyces TaxID=2593676 RepID=UPI000BBBE2E1|nr:ribonuclease [Streptomyces sp. WZ.A104]PCG87126.1 ribonuclease [Streptomyces sp. WZ.A104]
MKIPPRLLALGGAAAVAAALLVGPTATAAPTSTASVSIKAVGSICHSALPSQAHDTLKLIDAGGPFPYRQDGTVFQNRERVLPSQNRGYYHEYTVKTPGSSTRGARRIVTGRQSQEDYYTADHYATFKRINFSC